MALLDLRDCEQLAAAAASAAERVRQAGRDLLVRGALIEWHSPAASAFQIGLHEIAGQLGGLAADIDDLTTELRRHRARAQLVADTAYRAAAAVGATERAVLGGSAQVLGAVSAAARRSWQLLPSWP